MIAAHFAVVATVHNQGVIVLAAIFILQQARVLVVDVTTLAPVLCGKLLPADILRNENLSMPFS